MKVSYTLGIILLSALSNAYAESLFVLYDSGKTISTAPFFERMNRGMADAKAKKEQEVKVPRSYLDAILPVRTPNMTPGVVSARAVNLPMLPMPFFIIGSDKRSKQWLTTHRNKLMQLGAVGMLVQADTENDLKTIADIAPEIRISPVSGVDVANNLKLQHYPVLVSWQVIEQ